MNKNLALPSDPDLAPGAARCPGPSPQDILDQDGDQVPAALRAESYSYLGNEDMPLERYTSQAFFDSEIDNVWSKVWQWAAREEHLPESGDYAIYDIGPYSTIILRGDDHKIRAFVNSCPHRGMQFFDADSSGTGKQFLRCPFHGMSWHLDGSLREIPCRWDFPHVTEDNFKLTELPCDTWGGFVFINLDPNAGSLQDYLQVLPEHFAQWPLEDRYVSLHMEKELPGNWKMCMEGFLEAYHVLATHPQGLRGSGWANTQYDVFSDHVTRFLQNLSSGNPHFERPVSQPELFEFLGHDKSELPDGMRARQRHADLLRAQLRQDLDVDLSGVSNSELLDSIEYHLFPNACFFPGIVIPLIYRFRPLTVDTCLHEILLLTPVPENGPRPKPAAKVKVAMEASYTDVEAFKGNRLAGVLDQDTDNFKRQWAGMKASLKGTQTLGNYQEVRIRHFHMVLDKYLDANTERAASKG